MASLHTFQEACAARCASLDLEMTIIEDQISCLKTAQETLRAEHDQLKKQSEMCGAATAPIRRLPANLLAAIFLHCLLDNHTPKQDSPPLLFLQVCQFWRSVAISHCQLWTQLAVFSNPRQGHVEQPSPDIRTFTEQWLRRAGTLPLSLEFRPPPRFRSRPEDLETIVTSILVPFSGSCQILRLDILSVSPFNPFLTLPSSHLGQLESLELEGNYHYLSAPVFSSPPRLRKLSLTHVRFSQLQVPGVSRPFIAFPWVQLTHLTIVDEVNVNTWTSILVHCLNLQHGVFCLKRPTNNPAVLSNPPVHLPQLHYLDVETADGSTFMDLCGLRLPSLTHLCLRYLGQSRLLHGIAPQMPCLEHLCLIGAKPSHPIEFLKAVPTVSNFQIIGCPSLPSPSHAMSLLEALIPSLERRSHPILLPKLNTLSLESLTLSEPMGKLLSKLAISRGPNSANMMPLQDISVRVYNIRERLKGRIEELFTTFGGRLDLKELQGSTPPRGTFKEVWPCKRCT